MFSYLTLQDEKGENIDFSRRRGMYSGEFITERIRKETYAKRSSVNVSDEDDAMTKDNGLSSIAKRKEQLEKDGPKMTLRRSSSRVDWGVIRILPVRPTKASGKKRQKWIRSV